jgi:hypothetical protein
MPIAVADRPAFPGRAIRLKREEPGPAGPIDRESSIRDKHMQKLYYARSIPLSPKFGKGQRLHKAWSELRRARLVNPHAEGGRRDKRANSAPFCLQFSPVGMWWYLVIFLEKVTDSLGSKSVFHY